MQALALSMAVTLFGFEGVVIESQPFFLEEKRRKVLFAYFFFQEKVSGDPYGNRTHVCGVRGRRLNRLTNGPLVHLQGLEPWTP